MAVPTDEDQFIEWLIEKLRDPKYGPELCRSLHLYSDVDTKAAAQHHTIGTGNWQVAGGN